MADKLTPLRDAKSGTDSVFDRIKSDIDNLVNELNFEEMGQKVQEFGRQKPIVLALAAFSVGIAAGLLMKKSGPLSSIELKH